ncbi:hypothetical protein ACFV1X_21260 [Streptomyces coelicoflavus]|uniref:hypothetical protein n=1 Tax=Streptomyces coelicoflavus TaxID=285562 RepID=UPI00369F2359
MSTTRTGRDGRPLVTTAQAAYSLGKTPAQFRSWARRRGPIPGTPHGDGRTDGGGSAVAGLAGEFGAELFTRRNRLTIQAPPTGPMVKAAADAGAGG